MMEKSIRKHTKGLSSDFTFDTGLNLGENEQKFYHKSPDHKKSKFLRAATNFNKSNEIHNF